MNTRRTTRAATEPEEETNPPAASSSSGTSAQTTQKKGKKSAATNEWSTLDTASTRARRAFKISSIFQEQSSAGSSSSNEDEAAQLTETTGSKRKRQPRKTVTEENIYDATSSESSSSGRNSNDQASSDPKSPEQQGQVSDHEAASDSEDEPIGKTARTKKNTTIGKAKKATKQAKKKEASGTQTAKKSATKSTKKDSQSTALVPTTRTTPVPGGQIVQRVISGRAPQSNVPEHLRGCQSAQTSSTAPPTTHQPQAAASAPVPASPFPTLEQARAYDPPPLHFPGGTVQQPGGSFYYTEEQRSVLEGQQTPIVQTRYSYGSLPSPVVQPPPIPQPPAFPQLPSFPQYPAFPLAHPHQFTYGNQQQQSPQGNQQLVPTSSALPSRERSRGSLLNALAVGDTLRVAQIQRARADELSNEMLRRNRQRAEAQGRSQTQPPTTGTGPHQNVMARPSGSRAHNTSVSESTSTVEYYFPSRGQQGASRGVPTPEHGQVAQPATQAPEPMDIDMDSNMDGGASAPQTVNPVDLTIDPALEGTGPPRAPRQFPPGHRARCVHLPPLEQAGNKQDVDMSDWTPWEGMSNEEANREFGQLTYPNASAALAQVNADNGQARASQSPARSNAELSMWLSGPPISQAGSRDPVREALEDIAEEAEEVEDAEDEYEYPEPSA